MNNKLSKTYHHQANGQVERFNQTILTALRRYFVDYPRNQGLYAEAITCAYITPPQSTPGLAPFQMVLARAPTPLTSETSPIIGPSPFPMLIKLR